MKTKTKKIVIGASTLALAAAISISGTVAYLTKVTERRANNFTFAAEGLDAMLTEPEWDGVVSYEYTKDGKIIPVFGYEGDDPEKPIYGYEDGDKSKPITNPEDSKLKDKTVEELRPKKDPGETPYGDTAAQKMVPGAKAAKNPIITNTGEMDEWVAAKVTFVYGEDASDGKAGKLISDEDFNKIKDIIEIEWGTTTSTATSVTGDEGKWYLKEGAPSEKDFGASNYTEQMTFYYDTALDTESKKVTTPIFKSIKLSDAATTEQVKKLEDMGGFAIWIEGYAVQKSEFDNGAAWVGAAGTDKKAVFNNTPSDEKPAKVAQPGIIGSNGEDTPVKGNNSKS